MFGSSPIPFYLLLVNGYLLLLMYVNQRQEQKQGWQISDWQFLVLGVVGGGLGGLLGQWLFKQQTGKIRFRISFILGAILAVLLLIGSLSQAI